ncbi:MAG: transcriptional repressor [Chlorobi bacterium]|nr:transcriptional repressor [Chlorobiota bacterium]
MAKPEIIKSVTDILNKYMTRHHMRKTQERFKILEYVYDFDTHFDVEELYRYLKEKDFAVSKATVYNTLELLLKAGLVRKHYFNDNTAYYEKSYFNKSHDHIIVRDDEGNVEKIIEFCDPRIELIKNDLEKIMGVEIDDHDLYFYAKAKKE